MGAWLSKNCVGPVCPSLIPDYMNLTPSKLQVRNSQMQNSKDTQVAQELDTDIQASFISKM